MIKKQKFQSSSGQALLIVVVTMIVALTAGLSITSRTITNLKLAQQDEESQRAFQAASAGIDKLINSAAGTEDTGDLGNAEFNTKVLSQVSSEHLLNNGVAVDQNRGIDVWLSTYPDYSSQYNGNVTLFFGSAIRDEIQSCAVSEGTRVMPALEVLILTGSRTNPTFEKRVYDPCNRGNNFSSPITSDTVISSIRFLNNTGSIPVTNGLVMRVVPFYNSAIIGIRWQTGTTPPVQGKLLESTGKSGETQRKIIYFESHPQIPTEIFPYSILSQ